jgi:UDP-N-acetylmuramoylalanine--D-glutamate ligase
MRPLDTARQWFAGRSVGIVGLGREGLALARFMLPLGARVTATDDKPAASLPEASSLVAQGAQLLLGGLDRRALAADYCFVSPGVPLSTPLLDAARGEGVTLWNEPGLFLALCPAPSFGITGSAGKSTTASLVAAVLEASGTRTHLGGNIGRPLIERLSEIDAADAVVLELSSFQLELVHHSPRHALITNLTPNHLDRHFTMEAYVEAKTGIFRYQGGDDRLVLNADDGWCRRLAPRAPSRLAWFASSNEVATGACLRHGKLVARDGAMESIVCAASELPLPGDHNVSNALAATALCAVAGVESRAIREGLLAFTGLPHRLQLVASIGDVEYYDDSIATTPERSVAGMRALRRPVVLLAGGRDKHLPWDGWVSTVREHARAVIVFGEVAGMLEKTLAGTGVPVTRCEWLGDAVSAAVRIARPGEAVLLAPGGTSFDEFSDFEERGTRFTAAVLRLRQPV